MTEVSLSRFLNSGPGKHLSMRYAEIRLGHASRMLIETTQSINEIAYKCGFNNMSNFNRVFKKKRPAHPKNSGTLILHLGVRTFI